MTSPLPLPLPPPPPPPTGQPLTLTVSPRLDAALVEGWASWEAAAVQAGVAATAAWLALRLGDSGLKRELLAPTRALLEAADDEERSLARAELAEMVEGDDLVADTLWEGVLAHGLATDDPDLLFEAIARLAAIAEANADPLAAAEYHLDFLNWRRQAGHTSDPEAVETAFDEVIRLAGVDGAHQAAALFAYRQVGFTRLLDADDDRASEGDWEQDPAPYPTWA